MQLVDTPTADSKNENDFHNTLNDYREQQEAMDQESEEQRSTESDDGEQDEDEINIYALEPTEFLEIYKNLSADDKKHLYDEYKQILEIREQMNSRMKDLSDWCEERNIHFPTYKAAYKRANDPKKKQNMIDATFAFFAKELGGGYQKGLWD